MPNKLVEKRNELKAKQDKLHQVLVEMGDEGDLSKVISLTGDNAAKAAAIRAMNKELGDIGAECDILVELEGAYKADQERQREAEEAARKGLPTAKKTKDGEGEGKSLGELFTESIAFKEFKPGSRRGPSAELGIDLKTLMTTAAGWAPQSIRTGRMVEMATRPIQVIDLIPSQPTSQAAVVYMEETTMTNAAAEHTEGSGALGEAALAFTERSVTVQEIGVILPVTSQQLEDVDGMQSLLNNRLAFMCRQRLDGQVVVGNGTPPNLLGLLANTGRQTFVLPGDPMDAIYDAARRVRVVGRANPNAIIIHPNDWQPIRLKRSDTGIYILGNPNEPLSRIWGLTVVEGDVITENSALVGDYTMSALAEKKGIIVEISDSHDTYFAYNKLAVRATMRVAMVNYRPSAFCEISGM